MAASAEDALLRQILAVSLSQATAQGSAGDAPILFLADLAKVCPCACVWSVHACTCLACSS